MRTKQHLEEALALVKSALGGGMIAAATGDVDAPANIVVLNVLIDALEWVTGSENGFAEYLHACKRDSEALLRSQIN